MNCLLKKKIHFPHHFTRIFVPKRLNTPRSMSLPPFKLQTSKLLMKPFFGEKCCRNFMQILYNYVGETFPTTRFVSLGFSLRFHVANLKTHHRKDFAFVLISSGIIRDSDGERRKQGPTSRWHGTRLHNLHDSPTMVAKFSSGGYG